MMPRTFDSKINFSLSICENGGYVEVCGMMIE